ncbi:hypothetical protein PERMA_A0050 (plasmid) [Persephonella marina EX-H1]|uniref:Uncharacterized protein n=1 Tax=Persephonella marina (strain DSM 14350 / EX-H1) TaxID=123214 RepID=C0QUX9_PERMH|nr:hypothetical protein [Persephonella marina]ACO04984.1 hypothetical protein PERMA_A0050 [Persephonella marina EX-H1]
MGVVLESTSLMEDVLLELNTGGICWDFQRAEEIINEAGLDYNRVVKEIAFQIKENQGWKVDPVGIVYEFIKEEAEVELESLQEVEVLANYRDTQFYLPSWKRDYVLDELKGIDVEFELSKATKFLLRELQII